MRITGYGVDSTNGVDFVGFFVKKSRRNGKFVLKYN